MTRLLTIWDAVRSSLWAIPLVMAIAAGVLAYAALNTDLPPGFGAAWFLYSGDADEAPQFLANLVSSMITMATLAISITMVVLALAAQQLGPRLIRSFMADRRTQAMLGLFLATVVYLLLVLRSSYGLGQSVPNLAVTIGAALVLLCVLTLLFFVHHLARSIIADNVIARVGTQLDTDIRRLLPEKKSSRRPTPVGPRHNPVALTRGGHIQAIDYDSIVRAAAQHDASVKLTIRAGQHAVPGAICAYVDTQGTPDDGLCEAIRSAILLGNERTDVQDLEFSVHQLVEIALRALSPGINDAYTAVAVVDRLSLSLALAMRRGPAVDAWEDGDGVTRVRGPVSSFEGIVDAAFNQIRQSAAGNPAVLIRMASDISQLLAQADMAQRPVLEKQLRLVVSAGERGIKDDDDLRDLHACAGPAEPC